MIVYLMKFQLTFTYIMDLYLVILYLYSMRFILPEIIYTAFLEPKTPMKIKLSVIFFVNCMVFLSNEVGSYLEGC